MQDEGLLQRLMVLAVGSVLAALASLSRMLSSGDAPRAGRLLGGLLGAALASFSFGALVSTYFEVEPLFLLGSSGVVGWLGGDVMGALGQFLERKLGVDLDGDGKSG